MIVLLWPALVLLLYTLQTHWFMFFESTQSPDLLLLFVLMYALDTGGKEGAGCGLMVGILQDVVTFSFFGYHIITRTLLGFLVGSAREKIFRDRIYTFIILVVMASFIVKLVYGVTLCIYTHELIPLGRFLLSTFKYVGWNILCALPVWILYRIVREIMERKFNPYYH